MNWKFKKWGWVGIFLTLALATITTTFPVFAEDFESTNGNAPTFLQYLDMQGVNAKEALHMGSGTEKGEVIYSYGFDLPPAILRPTLAISYSSEGGPNLEMSPGWQLNGILEIRRPLSRAYKTKEKSEWNSAEWLISGPGMSGTLIPGPNEDGKFFMRSTSANVMAIYDENKNEWSVFSNGVTSTLSEEDDGEATDSGTALWRVTKMRDGSGNYISYHYDSYGCIQSISYGGNDITNAAHLVTVVFSYGDNVATRTSYRAGFLTQYKKHVELITVQKFNDTPTVALLAAVGVDPIVSDPSNSNITSWYAYDLIYSKTDIDQLTKITRQDKTSTAVETVATFEYTAFDSSDAASRTNSDVPVSLGSNYNVTEDQDGIIIRENNSGYRYGVRDPYLSSKSIDLSSMIDLNRDGLVDSVSILPSTEQNPKKVTLQNVDYASRKFSWNDSGEIDIPGENFHKIVSKAPQNVDELFDIYKYQYSATQLVDVDRDGYLDLLTSSDENNWKVNYGHDGGFDSGTTEPAPPGWQFAQKRASPNLLNYAYFANNPNFGGDDVISTLSDLNGDGWLDAVDSKSGKVCYHSGERGGGWTNCVADVWPFSQISQVQYALVVDPPVHPPGTDGKVTSCGLQCFYACGVDTIEDCKDKMPSYECEAHYDCANACTAQYCNSGDDESYHWGTGTSHPFISYKNDRLAIDSSDETKGLYDLNGDGLPDYVDAIQDGSGWKVHFNNGHGFEAAKAWPAPVSYTRRSQEGKAVSYAVGWSVGDGEDRLMHMEDNGEKPSSVYQMLLDVDSDGLLDLALGHSLGDVWYKNTGSGFEATSRPLPKWWPDDFVNSKSCVYVHTDSNGIVQQTVNTTTYSLMADMDNDGAVDWVSIANNPEADFKCYVQDQQWKESEGENPGYPTTDQISYGTFPRANLLKKVMNAQGGATTMTYRSLATVAPSGDGSVVQHTPSSQTLIDTMTSTDSLTNQTAKTSFDYYGGFEEDGLFQGFQSRDESFTLNTTWMSRTHTAYELSRDFAPLPADQKIFTDSNLSFGSSIKRVLNGEQLRFHTAFTYADYGGGGRSFHLLKTRVLTEHGESSGEKSVTFTYDWDGFGNLTSFVHGGGGNPADEVTTNFTYVGDNASSDLATFFRMKTKSVTGTDPISGAVRKTAEDTYYYDDHTDASALLTKGLLTRVESSAGWLDGGEALGASKLAIKYTRGSRGEVASILDEVTKIKMDQTFGFGSAVLKTQTNAKNQTLTRTLDDQGRVLTTTDDNQLTITQNYDGFNRVTKKMVTDKNGTVRTVSDAFYQRNSAPFYTMNRSFNNTLDGSGTFLENTSYAKEDGFGRMNQLWSQGKDGHYYVTMLATDLRGDTFASLHPLDKGTSFDAQSTLYLNSQLGRSYYDAMGEVREVVRDVTASTGFERVYHDSPRQTLSEDENGYQTRLSYDAHGRVIKVEQGKAGSFVTTATYNYDPLDRLTVFKDGKGVMYFYSYDGAGRLREVKYGGPGTTAPKSWYKYTYKGMQKTRMEDNTGAYSEWTYDAIGRTSTLKVSDSLPTATAGVAASPLLYTYSYDTAGWIGALAVATDPAGMVVYDYDSFGREKSAKRTYNASSVGTKSAEFKYTHDLMGRVTSETLPSGHKINSTYAYGYLSGQSALTSTTTDYKLTYDYNKWGLLSSVTSIIGASLTPMFTYTQSFTTPLWADKISLKYGANNLERAYKWYGDGLLNTRTETSIAGGVTTSTAYTDGYDNLKELAKISTPTKTIESYTYDAAGNPKTMTDPPATATATSGVAWTYGTAGKLNQILTRTPTVAGTGTPETYTYDDAGRVKTWSAAGGTRQYYYDGTGKLRGFTLGGVWQMVFDYDGAGNIVRRADNNPLTSSPKFTYEFRGWSYDEKTLTTTETENPFVATENGARNWLFSEYDGQVAATFNDAGVLKSSRTLGAYGKLVASTGTPWKWNSFHGDEEQGGDLFLAGQRHLMRKDGQWLEPEPLLYLGIPQQSLTMPLGLATYRYVANSPTMYQDPTGFAMQMPKSNASSPPATPPSAPEAAPAATCPVTPEPETPEPFGAPLMAMRPGHPEDIIMLILMGFAPEAEPAAYALEETLLEEGGGGLADRVGIRIEMPPPPERPQITLPSRTEMQFQKAIDEIKAGKPRPNVRQPTSFRNSGESNSMRLPTHDANGNPISYTEHTVNPKGTGGIPGLDANRIITGSDGSVRFTDSHYLYYREPYGGMF